MGCGQPVNNKPCILDEKHLRSEANSSAVPGCEAKVWVVTRWIKEKYVVLGETRHEAIAAIDEGQGPYEITVTKETCVPD